MLTEIDFTYLREDLDKLTAKRILLQEIQQTITETDGDARSLQSGVNGTKKKKTLSLPGDVHQHEEFRASISVMVSTHDVILNQQEDCGRLPKIKKTNIKRAGVENFLAEGKKGENIFQIGKGV